MSDTYNLNNVDGSTSVINFDNRGNSDYFLKLTVTEVDNTRTVVEDTSSSLGIQTRINILNASNNIDFEQNGFLAVDRENILSLGDVEQINITNVQRITYKTDSINLLDGNILADNINQFYYYDGLRFYPFAEDKENPLRGSGVLYYNPVTGTALYSININFNDQLDAAIAATTTAVSTVTNNPSTSTEVPNTPGVSLIVASTEVPSTDDTSTSVPTDMDITTTSVPTDVDITTTGALTDVDVTTTVASTDVDVTTTSLPTDMDITTTSLSTDVDVTTTSLPTDVDVTTSSAPSSTTEVEITTTTAPTSTTKRFRCTKKIRFFSYYFKIHYYCNNKHTT